MFSIFFLNLIKNYRLHRGDSISQKKLWIGTFALFFVSQLPCSADWQFTRWGMSPQDFVDAAPPDLVLNGSHENCSGLYSSDWKAGDLNFDVCYSFSENGLNRVSLYLKEPNLENAFNLKTLLERKYGDPTPNNSLKNLGISVLEWRTEAEVISYSESLLILNDNYTPFVGVYYETLNLPGIDGL